MKKIIKKGNDEAQMLAGKMLDAFKKINAGLNNYLKMLEEEFAKVSKGKADEK